eukprot:m51a1_g12742 hypothetical protein (102) ;mRNA; r:3079-3549
MKAPLLQPPFVTVVDPTTEDVALEWDYLGTPCAGHYIAATGVLVLNFYQKLSTVTVTYHVIDANTMAVCVLEVEAGKQPLMQYGNMYRIDLELYAKHGAAS